MSNALEKTHVVAAENNTTLLANLAEHTKVTKVNAEISHLAVVVMSNVWVLLP